ncbi:MAG: hypothetical protein KJ574_04635 [Nanoarchaeota archaeon]|nr:hypothetical protein [Nanoarchaeota archaeon]
MAFDVDKKNALTKSDKSKKGSVDELIKPLCDLVTSLAAYYTTSSCSGRTLLMTTSGKKNATNWLFVTHKIMDFEEMRAALKKIPKETVWFRFEPLILHIACKDMAAAARLLNLLHDAGFKRSGIISTQKIVIELIGTERIDAPVTDDGKLIVTDEYLAFLVNKANRKMVKNGEDIDKLFKAILKLKSGVLSS